MASVSLNAIGTALSKSGQVVLRETSENGYTRTHAADGYLRVNPFEVENGTAADPDAGSPYSLNDWEGYTQSDVNAGSALQVTIGYGELDVSWTKPAGYDRATAIVTQKVSIKSMGASEDLSVNPFDTPFSTTDAGDGTSQTVSATGGEFFAIGVKAEFDDSVTTHTNPDSSAYAPDAGETPLTGGGKGISSGAAVFSTAPTIDQVQQTTDPDTCTGGCTLCVDIQIDVTMEGTSTGTLQERIDSGSWSTVDSNVSAGSTQLTLNNRDDNKLYEYRLRYNDVSPDTWSNVQGVTTQCNLA